MQIAKVIGNVVSTVKDPSFSQQKMMLVQPLTPEMKKKGNVIIALDTVQAGEGDLVLVISEGNSSRQIIGKNDAPFRSVIAGIIDHIDCDVDK